MPNETLKACNKVIEATTPFLVASPQSFAVLRQTNIDTQFS